MHRSLVIGFLGIALIIAGMVRADAAYTAAPAKVAFVDLQRTLAETTIGKRAKKKLERDQGKKQKDLDKATKALEKKYEELNKQRAVLKPKVLRQREMEIQQSYVQLQEKYLKLQQELGQMEAKLVRDIFGKAAPVIEKISKRDGITIVFEKSQSAVLWADPAIDITPEVNKALDSGK